MSDLLFTIVCEFGGGTYVSQVRDYDERRAVAAWAKVLRQDQPMGDASVRIAIEVDERADNPVPLDGLTGVWCWSASVERQLVLANIVRSA